jgi:hypothetical protein
MRHQIIEIETFIKNRELYLYIYIEDEWLPLIETSFEKLPENIKQLSIFELNLLEGCYLEASSFYKHGEKMRNGKVAYEEGKYPKTWKITHEGSLYEWKERNKSKLLTFQSIYSVEVSQKNSKVPYVKVRTTDNKVYLQKLHLFENSVGIKQDEFYLLNGVFVSPVYYKKGNISQYAGKFTTITQDEKILAKFNFRIEGTLDHHYSKYGNPKMKNVNDSFDRSNSSYYNDNDRYVPSHEKYNAYNDFDDDTIDNAFEGDPESTWNVD